MYHVTCTSASTACTQYFLTCSSATKNLQILAFILSQHVCERLFLHICPIASSITYLIHNDTAIIWVDKNDFTELLYILYYAKLFQGCTFLQRKLCAG